MTDEIYAINSFAWIEYFLGSAAGSKARPFIEGGKGATPTIVICGCRMAAIPEEKRKLKCASCDSWQTET